MQFDTEHAIVLARDVAIDNGDEHVALHLEKIISDEPRWIVYYPPGATIRDEQDIDNCVIAKEMMKVLECSAVVPTDIQSFIDDTPDWRIELIGAPIIGIITHTKELAALSAEILCIANWQWFDTGLSYEEMCKVASKCKKVFVFTAQLSTHANHQGRVRFSYSTLANAYPLVSIEAFISSITDKICQVVLDYVASREEMNKLAALAAKRPASALRARQNQLQHIRKGLVD